MKVQLITKKVLIDARMVGPIPHGIARFAESIAKGLKQVQEKDGPLPYRPVFLVNPDAAKTFGSLGFHGFETSVVQSPFLSVKEWWELRTRIRIDQASLYHSTSFASLPRGLWPHCPWVQTVHDLNHLWFGGIKEKIYYSTLLKPFAKNAACLSTVSETSKMELIQWLGRTQIEIINNAMNPEFSLRKSASEVNQVFSQCRFLKDIQPGDFFFCLSSPKPHKNVQTLVDAYSNYVRNLGQKDIRIPLIISFDPSDDLTWKPFLGLPGVHFIPNKENTDLVIQVLLQNCRAFFFPSSYEGFGLPPIEAALSGARLVVSKISAHQEALMDCHPSEVQWVGPGDHQGWVSAFHRAARMELGGVSAETQQKISQRYSYLSTGRAVDRIYKNVLGLSK